MEQQPEIVFHRRGLAIFYYAMACVFAVLGMLFVMVAIGTAVEPRPWSEKWIAVLSWIVVALSWLLGIVQMWSFARAYRQNEVRIGTAGLWFRPPGGDASYIAFADIKAVRWDPSWRVYACTIDTAGARWDLSMRVCPRPGKVARLVAERAGVTLGR